ncbi:MAG TPA: hypothetical protein VE075_02845 [Thermoanaerobaculia bacterium]|nr:hypothetical protein [Thermoanaerobaculia bacterium]
MALAFNSLVQEVLSGGNRQLLELAASGLLPLPSEQLLPLQVKLARDGDAEIRERATASLRTMDPRVAAAFLAQAAGPPELAFFAAEVNHPLILETILRRRDVPRQLLVDLARRLPGDLQELLLLRQDAIVEEPAILFALEDNRQLTPYTRRRINEYREHLLPQKSPAVRAAIVEAAERITDTELAEAIEAVRQVVPEGEIEDRTGLSEGQIRMLTVPQRLRLTRGASRMMKQILIRDPNALVAIAVLHHNSFSEQEMEQVARSRSLAEDVLLEVSKRREWVSRYSICRALVTNPKTPVGISVRLMPKLSVRDLKLVSRDRNVADAVRSSATRLYTIKQK